MGKSIKIGIFLIAVAFIVLGGYLWYSNWKTEIMKVPPKAPINFIAKPISSTQVKLIWKDNSNNENGFAIYRDGISIAELPENSAQYVDSGRRPTTNYRYEIKAYNQVGESDVVICSAKTLNPPIVVWIDQIGVHDNGEEFLRDFDGGEISVGVIVTDGKTTTKIRLPNEGFYHLRKDEITSVKLQVFSTEEVGEYLRVAAIGYEDDGGSGEQLMYKLMDIATKSYIGGPTSILLTLSGIDFTSIFSEIFGAEDDWLGTYVSEWASDHNWGVDRYIDVNCKNKDGNVGLRLWFRIECPVYDYSSEKAP